jgi:hypothetical protein
MIEHPTLELDQATIGKFNRREKVVLAFEASFPL